VSNPYLTGNISTSESNRLMLFREQSLFIVRTVRNTQIHCVSSPYLTGNISARVSNRLMLFREQSLFIVRTVRDTQIHCVGSPYRKGNITSATKPNRLMLFGETAAVYCENRTEHRYTVWVARTSQETSPLQSRTG
jgi:hypothetical protein